MKWRLGIKTVMVIAATIDAVKLTSQMIRSVDAVYD